VSVIFVYFEQKPEYVNRYPSKSKVENFPKIRPVKVTLFHADGLTLRV